jgi:sulfur carrier protein ThiS
MSDQRFEVTLRVHGLGRQLGIPEGPLTRRYPAGATVGDALRDLGIRHEAEVSVMIDGRVVSAARLLEPDDALVVIPPLVGGQGSV